MANAVVLWVIVYFCVTSVNTKDRNHTSRQHQFKTGVLSPTLFNIYTSVLPPPGAPVQLVAYADGIAGTGAAGKYIQPYPQKVFAWTKQNNLILGPGKTACTLFTPDLPEYTSNLDLKYTTMHYHGNAPKGSGSYLRPKTHMQHTHPHHLSAHTQISTNHKGTHCGRVG